MTKRAWRNLLANHNNWVWQAIPTLEPLHIPSPNLFAINTNVDRKLKDPSPHWPREAVAREASLDPIHDEVGIPARVARACPWITCGDRITQPLQLFPGVCANGCVGTQRRGGIAWLWKPWRPIGWFVALIWPGTHSRSPVILFGLFFFLVLKPAMFLCTALTDLVHVVRGYGRLTGCVS